MDIALAWIPEHLIDTQDLNTFIGLDGTLASEQGTAATKSVSMYIFMKVLHRIPQYCLEFRRR